MSRLSVIGDMVGRAISNEIVKLCPGNAGWEYVGFNSYGGSITIPGIEIGGGVSGGVLKIRKHDERSFQVNSFCCGSIDTGMGISPVPVNVTFPLPIPGTGVIYKGINFQNETLEPGHFRGTCAALTIYAGCGPTAGTTFMFIGAKEIPGRNAWSFVPRIIHSSPAVIITGGVSGSFPDAGFTISVGLSI